VLVSEQELALHPVVLVGLCTPFLCLMHASCGASESVRTVPLFDACILWC